jgi:hypothetical protein
MTVMGTGERSASITSLLEAEQAPIALGTMPVHRPQQGTALWPFDGRIAHRDQNRAHVTETVFKENRFEKF